MIARIRLVVDVPFGPDLEEPKWRDRPGHTDSTRPGQEMTNEAGVLHARVNAAKHAETELVDQLAKALTHGVVVESTVEEVRD